MANAFQNPAPLAPEVWALHGRWRGERPAVESWDGVLTWAALIERSSRVANGLLALGLKPGDHAAVLMGNSLSVVEVLVGLMRAGIAAVPLNPSVTDESVAAMMADAGVKALFLSEEHAQRRFETAGLAPGALICRGGETGQDYAAWRDAQDASDPAVILQPQWVCNIIYSSGTTGQPKGIVHTHRQRTDWAYDIGLALRYDPAARALCVVGLHSNISWVCMLGVLLTGGTLLVERHFDAAEVVEAVRDRGATHTSMVPLMCQRLLDVWPTEAGAMGLRSLMCCGSPLPVGVKADLLERLGGVLTELYGSTEGVATVLEPEEAAGRLTSVGRPILGVDLRILGNNDRPVPDGEAGEIVGRARFMMDGYWNRPEATAEATWIDEAGERWLRTGDIGRVDAEGFLYVVDRKKDMILSGGQNIYPADIEALLFEHPQVAECAVVGAASAKWGESPVAVIVAAGGCSPDAEELRAWVNARLGKFQKVARVDLAADLPRNATGKVLKRELRQTVAAAD